MNTRDKMINMMYNSLSFDLKTFIWINYDYCKINCKYRRKKFSDYHENKSYCCYNTRECVNLINNVSKFNLNPKIIDYCHTKCEIIDDLMFKILKGD